MGLSCFRTVCTYVYETSVPSVCTVGSEGCRVPTSVDLGRVNVRSKRSIGADVIGHGPVLHYANELPVRHQCR